MDANIDSLKQKLLDSFRFFAVGEGHSIVKHMRDRAPIQNPIPRDNSSPRAFG